MNPFSLAEVWPVVNLSRGGSALQLAQSAAGGANRLVGWLLIVELVHLSPADT